MGRPIGCSRPTHPTQADPTSTPRQIGHDSPPPKEAAAWGGAQPDSSSGGKLNVSSGPHPPRGSLKTLRREGRVFPDLQQRVQLMQNSDHRERGTPEGEPTISIQLSNASVARRSTLDGTTSFACNTRPHRLLAMKTMVWCGTVGGSCSAPSRQLDTLERQERSEEHAPTTFWLELRPLRLRPPRLHSCSKLCSPMLYNWQVSGHRTNLAQPIPLPPSSGDLPGRSYAQN